MTTLSAAIAAKGLDEKRALRNVRRRLRYAQKAPPVRLIPGVPRQWCYTAAAAKADAEVLAAAVGAALIREYIAIFCRINKLVA